MGSFAKQKGKRGEREAVKIIQPAIDEVWRWLHGVARKEPSGSDPWDGMTEMVWDQRPQLFRNQNQSFEGGYDIDGLEWMALEIKRCETLQLNKWWEQTVRQTGEGQIGVLMYKQNRKAWRIQMYVEMGYGSGSMKVRVDISIDEFLAWFKSRLLHILTTSERRLDK